MGISMLRIEINEKESEKIFKTNRTDASVNSRSH